MGSTRLLEPRFAGFGRREGWIWAQEPRFAGFGTAVSAKPRNLWLGWSGRLARPRLARTSRQRPKRFVRVSVWAHLLTI